ncbi:hypothetical protein TTV2_gp2 [Torque teno virus 2]|uniref:Capsid protein n=1 Tax=Torque teno virus 2 TaxID=687341 RepID=Q9DTD2_9VIRU|nr:hypothetical protein TTV2_gp2 [Torque teno virus 2]BAB20604.1 unnamed protein product [Torque teno virus 2]
MAFWWWRRRRRARWRRRAAARRWRRRRPRRRRAARRAGRRRRVRRRRGRWRRAHRRWRRRRGRRRHKRKLIIRQWQPPYTRRCYIVGYLPLIMCGENCFSKNFATHSDDIDCSVAYGGGMTATQFTLRILYDEFQRHLNYWTASNNDLDLARYLGATITFFRHPDVDFIVQIHTSPPFRDTEMTGPSIHPGMLMLKKHRLLIPSLKTRPGRKHRITVRIGAPKTFEDKWYPQTDLCDVILVVIYATAADFTFPFGSPLTNTHCVNFQVLGSDYNDILSILPDKLKSKESKIEKIYKNIAYYNTKQTIAHLKITDNCKNTQTDITNTKHNDTQYKGNTYVDEINQVRKDTGDKFIKATSLALSNSWVKPTTNDLEYHTGMYSSIFLSSGRSNPELKGPYTDVCYNPLVDKGIGNIVWLDWCSKEDSKFDETKSKVPIRDMPLWAALFGYAEYASKETGDTAINTNARLTLICPYTDPMLFKPQDPKFGFVPYSLNFGLGRMPGDSTYVPIRQRAKWYACLYHQQEVIEAITQSGPFAYHCDYKSAVLGVKYKFKWIWGGSPIPHQVVRNPCRETHSSTQGGRKPRSVQVVTRKYNTPEFTWHSWDTRRGLFGDGALQRMLQQPGLNELYPTASKKRPKRDTLAEGHQEEPEDVSDFKRLRLQLQQQPWLDSSQEEKKARESKAQEEEAKTLEQQLEQQRLLGFQLRCLAYQVLQVQKGHAIPPQALVQ